MNILLQQSMIEEAIRNYLYDKGLTFNDSDVVMTFRTGRKNKTGTTADVTINKLSDRVLADISGEPICSDKVDMGEYTEASDLITGNAFSYDIPQDTDDYISGPDESGTSAEAEITPTESIFG